LGMQSSLSEDLDLRPADPWQRLSPTDAGAQADRIAAHSLHIRFHDPRHTAATLQLLNGVHPKKVSEMLGHSSVAIALSIYSHMLPSTHRYASTAMHELFAPGAAKKT